MQPRPPPSKPKYRIKDFAVVGNYSTSKATFQSNNNSCKIYCICNQFSLPTSRKCQRCHENYHSCVVSKAQGCKDWQCLHCDSYYLDPIFMPEQILIQTFFKTQSVYQCGNVVEFIFNLSSSQLKSPVQVRGLQEGRSGLAWPMHGQFFINQNQFPQPIIDFKPLLKNSNRKHRKQQALILPADKLKVGRNILTFSIPKLNPVTYQAKYQVQVRGIYFLGIYAIRKYSKQQLIQKTFQTSKIDKTASLLMLKNLYSADSEITTQKIKLCLECPYMKSRIKIPIRGRKCLHYMVICLDTLIQTRTGLNSREWLCPICSLEINQPVIDMFIFSILNDGSAGIQIILNINGTYQWLAFDQDDISLSSDESDVKNNIQNLQIEQKKNDKAQNQPQKQPQKPQIEPPKPSKPVETIDLDDDIQIMPAVPATLPVKPQQKKPLQIMIPQQTVKSTRQQQVTFIKQKLKKSLKQKFPNAPSIPPPPTSSLSEGPSQKLSRPYPTPNANKNELLLSDIKQLQFKTISYGEFVKKYFNYQYQRNKINEDIRAIFREVL